jgi:uncharacterized protein (TIGR03435 family)
MGMFRKPGLLTIANYTLKGLILETYRIKAYQLYGGSSWSDNEHYDIVGKAASNADFGQLVEMLKPMLAGRFQLKVHREIKELPVYALVVVKKGPKMKLAADQSADGHHKNGTGLIISYGMSMKFLAHILANHVDRPINDETGLTGVYEFELRFAADEVRVREPEERAAAPDASSTSLFQAIQEQLGLKLESRKGPVETIVIDHAERPSAN